MTIESEMEKGNKKNFFFKLKKMLIIVGNSE